MSRPCPNCEAASPGRYCPTCGQDNRLDRLEARAVLGETLENLVGWDSALIRTLRRLFTDPGRLAADYVEGRRRRFVNPARFCLLALALWFFCARAIGLDPMESSGFKVTPSGTDSRALQVADQMRGFLSANLDVLLYLSLPLYAFLLRFAFRKTGRNVAECLVLVLYLGGFRYLLAMLFVPIQPWLADTATVLRTLIVLAWSIRATRVFFGVGILEAMLKTIACGVGHVVGTVFFFLAVSLLWVALH